MTKEQLIAMGLTEEQAGKVLAASAEEMKGFIPKHRFDEVTEAKKQLEKDLAARDTQLEELKKVDAEGLKVQIEKLQGENKTAKEQFEQQVKQMKIDSAVELALTNAKAKNTKAVKALLDLEKAELDGDTVKGLDDQIKKLTESEDSKFLFSGDEGGFKGTKPGETGDGDKNEFATVEQQFEKALQQGL